MATIKEIEEQIEKIEGFKVKFHYPRGRNVRDEKSGLPDYPYQKAADRLITINTWKHRRIDKVYPGFKAYALNGYGKRAHGNTLLDSLRGSYETVDLAEAANHLDEISSLLTAWAEQYLADWATITPQHNDCCEDQVAFIANYISMMQLGNAISQVDRIRQFLSMQTAAQRKGRFTVEFVSGVLPNIVIFTDDIEQIDFADSLGIVGYQDIFIYKNNKSNWAEQEARGITKIVEQDLMFNGYEPDMGFTIEGPGLHIRHEIDEDGMFASPHSLYAALANSTNYKVRAMVALSVFLLDETIGKLKDDQNINVLCALASNWRAISYLQRKGTKALLTRIAQSKGSKLTCEFHLIRPLYEMLQSNLYPEFAHESMDAASRLFNDIIALPFLERVLNKIQKYEQCEVAYFESEYIIDWLAETVAALREEREESIL